MKTLFEKVAKVREFFKNKYWILRTRYQLAKDSGELAQWKPGTKKGNLLAAGGVLGFSALAAVVFLVAKREAPTHFEPPVTLKNLPRPKLPTRPVEVVTPAAPRSLPPASTKTPPKTATKSPAKAAPSKKTAVKSTAKPAKTAAKKPAKAAPRKPASSTAKKKKK